MSYKFAPYVLAFLFLSSCLTFLPAQAAQVDPSAIALLVGEENLPSLKDLEHVRDTVIQYSYQRTVFLCPDDRNWNISDPRLQVAAERVFADLVVGLPEAVAAAKASIPEIRHRCEQDIAAGLQPSNMEALMTYYNSPEGKRYQAFMHRIDLIMLSGPGALMSKAKPDPSANQPSEKQMEQYIRMGIMSHIYQSTKAKASSDKAAHRDTSGYAALGFIVAAAINKNLPEVEALYKEYAADLPGFEAFTQSVAAQNLFSAMSLAEERKMSVSATIINLLKANARKYEGSWKALCQTVSVK